MAEFNPKTVSERIVADTLRQLAEKNGAYTSRAGYSYVNGTMIPSALAPVLARAVRAGKVVRDGIAKTEKFIATRDPASVNNVTVQLQTNVGVHVRTLRNNGISGTDGNDGLVNTNRKIIPSTTPFNIPITELDDQPWFFPHMQLATMLFDQTVETIANLADNDTNAMDAYDMAKMIAYACWRGASGGGSGSTLSTYANFVELDTAKAYDDLYMVKVINQLDALMANGDPATSLGAFRGRRALLLRNELLGYIKTPKTGFVINAPQSNDLFWSPSFSMDEALSEGSQYRGSVRGYDMYEWNKTHQVLMEKYLGLNPGELDGILGIVSTPLSYAGGGVSKREMLMMQSTEYDGVVAFPYTKFGGAAYRMIFLIVDSTWTMPQKLQNKLYAAPVKSPARWDEDSTEPITKTIYDADGNPLGLEEVMSYIKPNGDNSCNVLIKLSDSSDKSAIKNATLVTTVDGTTINAFNNNGDGTYSVLIPKGSAASIAVTAASYTGDTISVTAKQASDWQYSVSKTLTKSA